MEALEHRKEGGEGVGLVERGIGGPFVEERDAKVEVGPGDGSEGLEEDVYDDIGVVELGVELVPL